MREAARREGDHVRDIQRPLGWGLEQLSLCASLSWREGARQATQSKKEPPGRTVLWGNHELLGVTCAGRPRVAWVLTGRFRVS